MEWNVISLHHLITSSYSINEANSECFFFFELYSFPNFPLAFSIKCVLCLLICMCLFCCALCCCVRLCSLFHSLNQNSFKYIRVIVSYFMAFFFQMLDAILHTCIIKQISAHAIILAICYACVCVCASSLLCLYWQWNRTRFD